ncbi:hypothetical protein PsYK624_139570 [Phanerochaete sordida]|uniref:Uncharacterized protein n=1 Tax=Phanerochaete sordida TaxID=48140 RepID=A0A9P3LJP4_9APHY|nr:hypothetical protein PsYK624_139570 [Phanerochaete sordida]
MAVFQLLGASTLAGFLTHRIRLDDFRSFRHLRQISPPRLSLVFLFFTAWAYFVITGLVLQGIGLDQSSTLCSAGIYVCVSLYGVSKLCVYFFLTERAYVVWCPSATIPRWRTPVYLVCLSAVLMYFGVVCHLFIVRIAHLDPRGRCMIGFRLDGVIILVVFDVVVSILMTSLFIWPLARTRFHSSQLRHIARRSVTAATIVLGTSCVNITVLAALNGQERGWICLASWEGDVLIGSIALFWLTSGSGLRPIGSLIAEARSFPSTTDSGSKRRPLRRPPLTPFTPFARPQSFRQSSLPTIMTHGMLNSGQSSRTPSFVGIPPPPTPALVHTPLAWSVSANSSPGLGSLFDGPVLEAAGSMESRRASDDTIWEEKREEFKE